VNIKVIAFAIFLMGILSSCGYKPSSRYIDNLFDDSIYVEVSVDRVEPENAPYLKDELNQLVYKHFKKQVASKAVASNYIKVDYKGTEFTPLAYDDNGYVSRYRVNTKVDFDMLTRAGRIHKTITSSVQKDIYYSSVLTSKLRTEAIKKGFDKALDEFLAYISARASKAK
jgi:hypothetical protein